MEAMKLKISSCTLSLMFAAMLVMAGHSLAQQPAQTQRDRPVRPQEAAFLDAEPRVGEQAPDFTLHTPNGEEITLSDLYADKPVVIEFGSITCPVYRGKIERMNRLRAMYGDAVEWLVVYTVEAHPSDSPDPYTGRIWPHERNEEIGLLLQQPTDHEGRAALARRTIDEFGEQRLIAIDGMDNAIWEAWGRRPNSAFVIGTDGTVGQKQLWSHPGDIRAALVEVVGPPQRDAREGADRREGPQARFGPDVKVLTDLQYGEVDGHPLLLDAYLPATGEDNPAVIYIHGGGWQGGNKDGAARAVRADILLPQGVAVFSIAYRLSGVAPYPAAVDDTLAAVRWIRANASEFGVDPDNLAVWGGSAGGHLALMIAFREPGSDDLDATGGQLQSFVRCAVALNPPTDFMADDEMHTEGALVAFMAARRDEAPERYREASPITYLSPGDPPVYVMHGTDDRKVPYGQALLLQDAAAQAGVEMELVTFEGAGHGLRHADPEAREAAMRGAVEFVLRHLGR